MAPLSGRGVHGRDGDNRTEVSDNENYVLKILEKLSGLCYCDHRNRQRKEKKYD